MSQLDRGTAIVNMRLSGTLSETEMLRGFENLRNVISELKGADFRVFSDERDLRPLSPAAARVQVRAKAYVASVPGFLGNAVVVTDPITSMQSRRTSVAARIVGTELVSSDEREAIAFLGTVGRSTKGR